MEALRDRLPTLVEEAGLDDAQVRLAGDTALAGETVETIKRDLVRIGIAAFLVNFLLLALFLRAIVAPLYLVLSSGLALAASIGLTTLVFQGFLGHGELTYHVPFAVAVLLLSLGSDYNVFVVGRIWQHAEELPLREAIATAAPRASRAIGVAGLALALSFAALALIDLRQFREFAFAMSRRRAARRVRDPRAPDPRADLALRRPELVAAETAPPACSRSRCRLRNEERALSGALDRRRPSGLRDRIGPKEFAKPVAISSVHPADFPLAGTATRINFDLVTLRAWRSTNVSGLAGSYKSPRTRTCRNLRRATESWTKKIRRAGHAFVHSSG